MINILQKFKRPKNSTGTKKMSVITFEQPETVLTDLTYYQSVRNEYESECYTTPVDRLALSQLPNINSQHGGIVYARRNMLLSTFIGGGMSYQHALECFLNLIVFGDLPLLKRRNIFGQVTELFPLMSLYFRIKKDPAETQINGYVLPQKNGAITYDPDDVIYIRQPDTTQRMYGYPDYMGGVNSAMLNSESTMFRRRYYNNGAHMGYIFYATDPNLSDELEEEIKEKIKKSKGVGNFRSMFINIPNGSPDGVKLIPVGDMSAKDEFASIKTISSQDLLNAHRYPAGLAGVVAQNGSNNGDIDKLRKNYMATETKILQDLIVNTINTDEDIQRSPFKDKLLLNFEKIAPLTSE